MSILGSAGWLKEEDDGTSKGGVQSGAGLTKEKSFMASASTSRNLGSNSGPKIMQSLRRNFSANLYNLQQSTEQDFMEANR